MQNPELFPSKLRSLYRVERLLGTGGFGAVYEVSRLRGGKPLALKVFGIESARARIERELKAATALRHKNVIQCGEGGVLDGVAYLEMEIAEGNLRDRIKGAHEGSHKDRQEAWACLLDTLEGLAALHARGWVHRDLKPENVLLVKGVAKIADFGLTRGQDLQTLTAEGIVVGTPRYMAPEQAQGARPHASQDVFAWATMVVELLEGGVPWDRGDPVQTVIQLASGQLAAIPKTQSYLQPEAFQSVEACLSIAPLKRPIDLKKLAEFLRAKGARIAKEPGSKKFEAPSRVVSSEAPRALTPQRGFRPGPTNTVTTRKVRRPARKYFNLVAVLLFSFLVGLGFYQGGKRASPKREAPQTSNPSVEPVATFVVPLLKLAQELEVADLLFVAPDGTILAETERNSESQSLMEGDPARWSDLVDAVPSLKRSLRFLRSIPPPPPPSEMDRELWEKADTYFRGRGITPPFVALLPDTDSEDANPSTESVRKLLNEIQRINDLRKQELGRGLAGETVSANLKDFIENMKQMDVLHGNRPGRLLEKLNLIWHTSFQRRTLVLWFQTENLVRKFLRAVQLGLQEQTVENENLAIEICESLARDRSAWSGSPLDLSAEETLYASPETPFRGAGALVAAMVQKMHLRLLDHSSGIPLKQRALYREYLLRGLVLIPEIPVAAQAKRLSMVVELLMSDYAENEEYLVAQKHIASLLKQPEFPVEFHDVAHSLRPILQGLQKAKDQVVSGEDFETLKIVLESCRPLDHQNEEWRAEASKIQRWASNLGFF